VKNQISKILILDFGSQYTQLIARRIRELGVYCEIYSFDASADKIRDFAPQGIILSGGPESVHLQNTPRIADVVFELACPLLGICYGMQALAHQLGGNVEASSKREYGHTEIYLEDSILWEKLEKKKSVVWMSHGDKVVIAPPGFKIIATSNNTLIAAIADDTRRYYGIQFHPEVTQTADGLAIIEQFVFTLCGAQAEWTTRALIPQLEQTIREQLHNDGVLLALSGGVDSCVVAALLHRVVGNNLTCVFVDNGLLRLNEANQVMNILKQNMGIKIIKIDAQEIFFESLRNINDPEEKRKIIGKIFVEIFNQEASRLSNIKWLAQGTIYPDIIESAGTHTGKAHAIKSHHNVGGLPEKMHLKLCEPLRMLFKDEVRKLGLALGLPEKMVFRHPFPGPGLAVRILGEVKASYINILRQADAIFIECLHKFDYYNKVSQAFAVFLPVKAVGVMGDARSYEYVIALRAVETTDFMTARWAHLPYEILGEAASRIINEVPGIARVTYDISNKPPATIEWE